MTTEFVCHADHGDCEESAMLNSFDQTLGVAIVGVGGGVATTAAAGVELLRQGAMREDGLPLADVTEVAGLVPYTALRFAGWDLSEADLAMAARHHGVVPEAQLSRVAPALAGVVPWAAVADPGFCRNVTGKNVHCDTAKRRLVARIQRDLDRFADELGSERIVVMNLASTERVPDMTAPCLQSLAAFEDGLDASDSAISPSMLYAYAAIDRGLPYGNFTPNVAAECPALIELARESPDPSVRRQALFWLAELDDPRAVALFEELLSAGAAG